MRLSKDTDKALQEIEKKLNELEAMIKQASIGSTKNEIISIIENNDKTFSVKFKTNKGYIESDSTQPTGFRFTGE